MGEIEWDDRLADWWAAQTAEADAHARMLDANEAMWATGTDEAERAWLDATEAWLAAEKRAT